MDKEVKKESKIIKLAIKYGIIIIAILFLIGIAANAIDLLKDYSENQERKEIIKFMCNKRGGPEDLCKYDESSNEWQYEVMPKTKDESERIITPEKKFFTNQKDCMDFCYQDFMKIDKKFLEEILSKEIIEKIQKTYPELEKSLWYKINNWLNNL